MNSLVQPNALKALLRSLKEKFTAHGHEQGAVVAADTLLMAHPGSPSDQYRTDSGGQALAEPDHEPGRDSLALTAHAGTTDDAANLDGYGSHTPLPSNPAQPHAPAPPRFEVDLSDPAFASVFGLGNLREPRQASPVSEPARALAPSPMIHSPLDLASFEELDKELSLLDAPATALDLTLARQAGIKVRDMNDLQALKGIGPKIADLLNEAGIRSFVDLSANTEHELRNILDRKGSHYRLAKPADWIAQASLAARNDWPQLRDWQASHRRPRRKAQAGKVQAGKEQAGKAQSD